MAPQGASANALLTAVNGSDPWSELGPLTGSYTAAVTALESDCSYGPDVPFDSQLHPVRPLEPFSQSYSGTIEQRGDEVVFELGEGMVFARLEGSRLVEVVRVAAEGVTHFDDDFAVAPVGSGYLVSGDSSWTFADEHWSPGETCSGRTSLILEVRGDAPKSAARDLQFVLRWPVHSSADLDLMVRPAGNGDQRAYLGRVGGGSCFVLRSSGTAGAAEDSRVVGWIHPLGETALPHHEEVIRCANGAYGVWEVDVVNWGGDEPVDFEVEVFEGPTLGVNPSLERAIALLEQTATPHSFMQMSWDHVPPPPSGIGIVIDFTLEGIARKPAQRPLDPISHTALGFNKAAALDVSYGEFLANVGLD
jgi:hypothetical protein